MKCYVFSVFEIKVCVKCAEIVLNASGGSCICIARNTL
jgi:hypothetical protein